MRIEIHVRPNAAGTVVGGSYDGALVVRVREPAHSGRATRSALEALANALALPRRSVSLVRGATSRRKLVEIEAPDERVVTARIEELLRLG